MAMLWVKTFHIVFIASWFAGLFYLPRIFVNLAQQTDASVQATLLGMEELMHNANEATTSALGLTERSHSKDNLLGMDTMGAMTVRALNGVFEGVEFSIGTGFTSDQRKDLWSRRHDLNGRVVKFKWFPGGSKDAPRFPVFLGFRDRIDM